MFALLKHDQNAPLRKYGLVNGGYGVYMSYCMTCQAWYKYPLCHRLVILVKLLNILMVPLLFGKMWNLTIYYLKLLYEIIEKNACT